MHALSTGVFAARRAALARGLLATMLSAGATINESASNDVVTRKYGTHILGVNVECTLYSLPPHEWAEVRLRGAPFGFGGVRGRAWNRAAPGEPRQIEIEHDLERALRNRGAQVLAVYPLATDPEETLMVEVRIPMLGRQVVSLVRV
ncbi:MAG: hypothetical protein ACKVI4_14955 [Actinomycetales bacterium]